MATKLISHNMLTLDFWQENVIYEGRKLPSGSIGCAALNISDKVLERLNELCMPVNLFLGALNTLQVTSEQMDAAKAAIIQMLELLRKVPPFHLLEQEYYKQGIEKVLAEDYLQNCLDYLTAIMEQRYTVGDPQYEKGMKLLRLLSVFGHLAYSIGEYKKSISAFAEELHSSKRTPEGYAAAFGKYFGNTPTLDENNPSWMSMTNITAQYAVATIPGKKTVQLVKRMHYVSFVGLFRSDLFEGLCVGHAPKKCPICGRWFLTTDARNTKYCNGLAPNDPKGRTCRQVGNAQGRKQREQADDHPIKAIYTRRANTILQYTRRGKLDERTAEMMKRLAKDKEERALSDRKYALTRYEKEMEQAALLAEAQKLL